MSRLCGVTPKCVKSISRSPSAAAVKIEPLKVFIGSVVVAVVDALLVYFVLLHPCLRSPRKRKFNQLASSSLQYVIYLGEMMRYI